jgi:hypothetical protein
MLVLQFRAGPGLDAVHVKEVVSLMEIHDAGTRTERRANLCKDSALMQKP